MAALHEHQFPLPSLSVRCWFVEGTFAKGNGNEQEAPIAVVALALNSL
jgi:hypothetical protein